VSVIDYLQHLNSLGIELSLHANGQDLSFRAVPSALTAQLRQDITRRKTEIVDFLKLRLETQDIKRSAKNEKFRLSTAQQRLWFQEQFHGTPNNLSGAVRLRGPLVAEALEAALQGVVKRHATFRTCFGQDTDGQPYQDIDSNVHFFLQKEDLSDDPNAFEIARQRIIEQASQRFDLKRGPLLRSSLFRLGDDDHILFVSMPHIAADGVSLQIFDQDVSAGYQYAAIQESDVKYVDYAEWEALQPPHTEALAYWRAKLTDAPLVTLPADVHTPQAKLYQAAECSLPLLDSHDASQLKQFGRQRGATPFMTLLAAYALSLSRASGEPDLTIATAINHRPKPELQRLIGFFLNIIALRVQPGKSTRFADLLDSVRQTCLEAYQHQALPFEQLVEDLQPERVESRNPLARIAFAFGDTPWMPCHTLKLQGLSAIPVEIERGMLDFDMHLWISDGADGLTGRLEFRSDLYSHQAALASLTRFKTLLQQLVARLDRPLRECDGVSASERSALLSVWSGQPVSLARNDNVVDTWRRAASRFAAQTALEYHGQHVTYRTLDQLSDNLAGMCIARGVQPGSIVALQLPPGVALTVAMLAVLKAGGAYLPLEMNAPLKRLRFMLDDSQSVLIITTPDTCNQLNVNIASLTLSDAGVACETAMPPVVWPRIEAGSLAYLMYTSGSTGEPKGVRVPHRAICRLVLETNYIHVLPSDRVAQLANSAFDAFTFEIWSALLNGASVLGIDRDRSLNPTALGESLVQGQATILFVTTALFNLLAREVPRSLSGLRYLLFGGEQADVGLVRGFLREPMPQRLLHVYGPTENTTFSTFHVLNTLAPTIALLPIGQAISGTSVFVLAPDLALLPPGTTGELFLGGDGLADGYLNRPTLDDERFVAHPFVPGARLYRTGDRVRFNAEAQLEFIGRVDHQIKLRGFRIELGEIEAKLLEIAGVESALVVLETARGVSSLVAYLGTTRDQREIRYALAENLPAYMIPSAIICLQALPLNRNGKIDRTQLTAIGTPLQRTLIAPRDNTEEQLVKIWCDVIGCSEVSTEDNFFDIGGHSLLATRVAARVSEHFRIKTELRALFEHPTVARYASWLRAALKLSPLSIAEKIPEIVRDQPLLLSSAQERLWFLDQMTPNSPAYNISYALGIKGQLAPDVLERALGALLQRHESLRTCFKSEGGKPFQVVLPSVPFALSRIDLSSSPHDALQQRLEDQRLTEALRPFQTAQAPLLRACLYQLGGSTWVLGLSLHHIIADGWSLSVLRRDLGQLYDALLHGRSADLPKLPIQYADYAHWDRSQRVDAAKHLTYWKAQLEDLTPLRLPTDLPRPVAPSFRGAAQRFTIDTATTSALRALAKQCGATLYMTLLTAFAVLLQRYSRQDDFAVGSPLAHRNHLDTENLIGFFVNTLVMRCRMNGDDTFVDHLRQMRETTLAGYAHQDLPFERLVEELDPERDASSNPLIQVIFALQNAPSSRQQLSEMVIEPLEYLVATTRFDLELHLWENEPLEIEDNGLHGILVYDTALFHASSMACFCRCFTTLLEAICDQPEARVSELNILSQTDRARALAHNAPARQYPREQSIVDLYREQVIRHPERVALLLGEQRLTYGALDAQSTHLAQRLRQRGVGREAPVLLRLEPSFACYISMLAILKAGGCYTPVDPNEPEARLAHILASLKPCLTIDSESFSTMMAESYTSEHAQECESARPENLAYILFTSGSTGQPKGVRIPHRAVVRLVKETNFHPFTSDEIWLQAASLAFDASTLEIWGALLNGAGLAILPPGKAAFSGIGAAIRRHQVTSMWLTAGLFNALVDTEIEALRGLKYLIAGGDVLSVKHVQKALRNLPGLTIVNGYGPTENTTFTCCHVMQHEPASGLGIPIGKPISNTYVYIVDQHLQPVPDGMPGELVAGGDGLARDYLDSPELTEARFIPDHLSPHAGGRLYRTGDLVRRGPNGDIEFIGRLDDQVKVRGFRIETGEIEHLLQSHPEVQDVAVQVQGQAEHKQLIAYVVPAIPKEQTERTQLGAQQVDDWEKLFDESLYQELEAGEDPTFNIAGWKSSFNGEPIPAQEMRAWLDDFVQTVNGHHPKHVLEIGCGTGMVLFRVAPHCESYVGTDFSSQALAHVKRHLVAETSVKLLQREALNFGGFSHGQFDTVVINSVIQYFPDADYLHDVIAGCLPLIQDGGHLILGDLRSQPLLRAFHSAVTFGRSNPKMRLREWHSHVDRALLEEDELALAPGFFSTLKLPRISGVSFRLQRPTHDNELSKFRYTVIIEVGAAHIEPALPWADTHNPADIEHLLQAQRPARLGLRSVANSRVSIEVALAGRLAEAARQDAHLDTLKRQLTQESQRGVDPEVWWTLGERLGYTVAVGWSDNNTSGAYDVVFTAGSSEVNAPIGVPAQDSQGVTNNHPMRGKLARALGPKLRALCQEKLPEYMLPAHFIMLPALPLTANGKIDKRALCLPSSLTTLKREDIVVAKNDLERTITAVWENILGLEHPSVTDNFFDLGGHSMLMVQVCNLLRDLLAKEVPVLMMFQYPTIRSLADALRVEPHANIVAPKGTQSAVERARRQRASLQQRVAKPTERT